jgi:hypothetical protein
MDRKQVIVVALLIVAIVLSTASVLMNVQVLNHLEISESGAGAGTGNIVFEVLPQDASNSNGGSDNG